MQINFRAENGLCPYFIYKDIKFFIQDTKDTNGIYVYSLYLKNLKTETKHFENHKEACAYVTSKNNTRNIGSSGGKILYTNVLNEYIIDDKTVIIRSTPRPLSGDFDKYNDCLEFAKTYIANYIKALEPKQLEFNLLEG